MILVFVSGLYLNLNGKEDNSNSSNKKVSITLLDKDTNEILVGVRNQVDNSYSNFDGELLVNKNSLVSLELISYNGIQLEVKNDTIIRLTKIK
jgi:hypothetical protein